MATAGSITISLLMATGQFETDTKRAEQIAKKRAAAIDKAFEEMGQKIGIAAGIAGTAIAAMVANTANAAKEIANLAEISGAGTQEFQRFAAGAKSVGLEQGKLGDIFKDFREKVGEFVSTGGGGMKDFFEQVAPKIGITADAFRNLSGPQALQLYVDSLEKAGLSSEEMSFYLESMASDTTALIPLLRNGGAEMKKLGDEAERTGQVMSDETLTASKELAKNITEFQGILTGISNTIASSVIPTLNTFSSQFLTIAKDVGAAQAALVLFGGAVARTLGLDEVTELSKQAKTAAFNVASLGRQLDVALAMPFGLGEGAAASIRTKLEAEMKRAAEISDRIKQLTAPVSADAPVVAPIAGSPWRPPTKPPKTPRPGKSPAIDYSELDEISKQFDALYADRARKQKAVQDEAARLYESTREPLEKLNIEQAHLDEMLGKGVITWDTYSRAVMAAEEAYRPFGETLEESSGYWEEWLKSAETAMGSFEELSGDVIKNFSSQFGSAFEKMVFDSNSLGDAVSGLAEGMARSVVNALGQMAAQWLAYQAVQMIVGKTTASAAATGVALEAQAMATMAGLNAFASTAAIPIVGPAMAPGAMAAALSVSTPLAATIASLSAAAAGARASGGPVTGDTPYLVGERGAELFVPNTSGAIVPNSKLGGGNVTVNMIEDKSRAGQTQERTNNGQKELDVFVADIMGDGPRSKAMKQAFGLQRRGY